MIVEMKGMFVAAEKKQGVKDPTKTYYNALFIQGTDTANFNITESVFQSLLGLETMTNCQCFLQYNSKYNSLRCTDVLPL